MKTYTPTWNYIASALNFLVEKEIWKVDNEDGNEYFKIPEGVRLILIISCASIIEGALKTYLKEVVNGSISENELIKNANDSRTVSEITNQESVESFFYASNEKGKQQLFVGIISVIKDEIENASWSKLLVLFEKITQEKLKDLLNEKRNDLFSDVAMIFQFRNFIIHSTNIQHKVFNENEFDFMDKSKTLIEYLQKNRLIDDNYKNEGKFFVEYLIPAKLICHFGKILNEYLNLGFFRNNITSANLINLVYQA